MSWPSAHVFVVWLQNGTFWREIPESSQTDLSQCSIGRLGACDRDDPNWHIPADGSGVGLPMAKGVCMICSAHQKSVV